MVIIPVKIGIKTLSNHHKNRTSLFNLAVWNHIKTKEKRKNRKKRKKKAGLKKFVEGVVKPGRKKIVGKDGQFYTIFFLPPEGPGLDCPEQIFRFADFFLFYGWVLKINILLALWNGFKGNSEGSVSLIKLALRVMWIMAPTASRRQPGEFASQGIFTDLH